MSGQVEFELTAQDHVDAVRAYTGRVSGKVSWALLFVALLYPIVDIWAGTSILEDTAFWVFLSLALLFLAWDWLARDWIIRRQFRESLAMRSPIRIRWDDSSLWMDTDNSQARYDWSQFYRWKATETTLLLLRDSGFFILIPRRAVGDEGLNDMVTALKAAGVKER